MSRKRKALVTIGIILAFIAITVGCEVCLKLVGIH